MDASDDLLPEVISMGTCRTLRVVRVGRTYVVECLHILRKLDDTGNELTEDVWKVVTVVRPTFEDGPMAARDAAIEWLKEANKQVLDIMRLDLEARIAKEKSDGRK